MQSPHNQCMIDKDGYSIKNTLLISTYCLYTAIRYIPFITDV